MTESRPDSAVEELQSQIRALHQELDEANKGTIALSLELEELREKLARQADESRRANAELKSANAELSAFSYSVSHDLRAPLRAMLGFSAELQEDYAEALGEEGMEVLQRIRRAGERMSALIVDLLELSRMTSSDMLVQDVDMTAIAREVLAVLRQSDTNRHVEVGIEEGLTCRGDARLIRNLLENLLGNAWKFTARCESPTIQLGATVQSGRRVYYVRDNGAGFNMAYADKLFTPFQRLHTEEEYPGTGIGLATVRRIIRRHGGEAWAEGEPDKGATFYFTLALSPQE